MQAYIEIILTTGIYWVYLFRHFSLTPKLSLLQAVAITSSAVTCTSVVNIIGLLNWLHEIHTLLFVLLKLVFTWRDMHNKLKHRPKAIYKLRTHKTRSYHGSVVEHLLRGLLSLDPRRETLCLRCPRPRQTQSTMHSHR